MNSTEMAPRTSQDTSVCCGHAMRNSSDDLVNLVSTEDRTSTRLEAWVEGLLAGGSKDIREVCALFIPRPLVPRVYDLGC
jgi:hypothetical protein